MHDDSRREWETVGRCLLYTELTYESQERFEEAVYAVAEDILDGKEVTTQHLEQLAWMLEEILLLIRECIVPLIDSSAEWRGVFELAEYPS